MDMDAQAKVDDDRQDDLGLLSRFLNQSVLNWGTEHFEGKTYGEILEEAQKYDQLFQSALEVKVVEAQLVQDTSLPAVIFSMEVLSTTSDEIFGYVGEIQLQLEGQAETYSVSAEHLSEVPGNSSFPDTAQYTYVDVVDYFRKTGFDQAKAPYKIGLKVDYFTLSDGRILERF
jgi:hypothetical protein